MRKKIALVLFALAITLCLKISVFADVPNLKLNIVTPTPIPNLNSVTPTPILNLNVVTPTPILNLNIVTPTPTLNLNIVTPTPILNLNIVTPTPTLNLNIVTPTPTLNLNIVTPTPTLNLNIVTPTPTPNLNFSLPGAALPIGGFGTLLSQKNPVDTWYQEIHTGSVNRIAKENVYYLNNKILCFSNNNTSKWTVETSTNLKDWTKQKVTQEFRAITDVVFANETYLLTDDDGYAFISKDCVEWTAVKLPGAVQKISAEKDLFIARLWISKKDEFFWSKDGITWTKVTGEIVAGDSFNNQKIHYVNNQYVIFGTQSNPWVTVIYTSKDGMNWSRKQLKTRTKASTIIFGKIAYLNGVYVAEGAENSDGWVRGMVCTSKDLEEWTVEMSEMRDYYFYGLRIYKGQFVSMTAFGILSSTNGHDWETFHDFKTKLATEGLEYLNGYFITSIGPPLTFHDEKYETLVSKDMINWQRLNREKDVQYNSISYNNLTTYVAVGSNGRYAIAKGTSLWKEGSTGVSTNLNSIVFAKNRFVAVGANGVIVTSQAGEKWSKRVTGTTLAFTNIKFINDQFIAWGEQGVTYTSKDGLSWNSHYRGVELGIKSICYGNGKYLILKGDGVAEITTDFKKYDRSDITVFLPEKVIYGADKFVAVSKNGEIATSVTGEKWERNLDSYPDFGTTDIAYQSGTFMMTGERGNIGFSKDLMHWTFEKLENKTLANPIFLKDSVYVAGEGMIYKSGKMKSLLDIKY